MDDLKGWAKRLEDLLWVSLPRGWGVTVDVVPSGADNALLCGISFTAPSGTMWTGAIEARGSDGLMPDDTWMVRERVMSQFAGV
jgi:hypothetical protein